jgi:hypothetical protein
MKYVPFTCFFLGSEPGGGGGSYRMSLTDGNRFTPWTILLRVILCLFVWLVGWLFIKSVFPWALSALAGLDASSVSRL